MLIRALHSEWKKSRWMQILTLLLAGAGFSVIIGGSSGRSYIPEGLNPWIWYYSLVAQFYSTLFYPILAGVTAALVCRYEHEGRGWKQLLALPVSRTMIYLSKLILSAVIMALAQIILLLMMFAGAFLFDVKGTIPWEIILSGMISGWIAVLPLLALQLWVSSIWQSFALPLTLNIIFTIPAILIGQSATYGPYYPWAQPFIAMMKVDHYGISIETNTLIYVIIGGFLIALIGGLVTFHRRDWA